MGAACPMPVITPRYLDIWGMHPSEALFQGRHQPGSMPVRDHYAGSRKRMCTSTMPQQEPDPFWDITLNPEGGAATSREASHVQPIASIVNSINNRFGRIGLRAHDNHHEFFEQGIGLPCKGTAKPVSYLVVPKINGIADLGHIIAATNPYIRQTSRNTLPVRMPIETQCAPVDAQTIAVLPQAEPLPFDIIDFVSEHHGVVPDNRIALTCPARTWAGNALHAKLSGLARSDWVSALLQDKYTVNLPTQYRK